MIAKSWTRFEHELTAEEYGTVNGRAHEKGGRYHGRGQRQVSPWIKAQVVLWEKTFLERGAEIFGGDSAKEDFERRIAELEQLLGKKEVEIAFFRHLTAYTVNITQKITLARTAVPKRG